MVIKKDEEDDPNEFSFKNGNNNEKKPEAKRIAHEYSDSINRIAFAGEIRDNPPDKNFLKTEFKEAVKKNNKGEIIDKGIAIVSNDPDGKQHVEFTKGIFTIDLNTDADWWFNRSCTVFPLLLDQGIRTHVDIKDGFRPEKRRVEFNYIWVIILALGIMMIILVVFMLLGGA